MHDPSTVAFAIKYPWRKYGRNAKDKWARDYRASFITIWHEDPLRFAGKCGCRDDDSCGWFSPPYSPAQRERIQKLGRSQYSTLFEKQLRTREGKDYARICYEPSAYDAIYWAWRAINHSEKHQGVWQYGTTLTGRELEEIFSLASNPVDNLRSTVEGIKDEDSCASFFMLVYRAWRRFNRPWYQHPRWHVWHWRLQVHPVERIWRWLFQRCSICGGRFGIDENRYGNWNGDKVWHDRCQTDHSPAVVPNAATNTFHPVPHDHSGDHHAGSVH